MGRSISIRFDQQEIDRLDKIKTLLVNTYPLITGVKRPSSAAVIQMALAKLLDHLEDLDEQIHSKENKAVLRNEKRRKKGGKNASDV
jgi:hypothetical protein